MTTDTGTFRFQTHQAPLYRVYVGGERVEFHNHVAVVSAATAAKLRSDPLCGQEFFEVTKAEVAAAPAAVPETGGPPVPPAPPVAPESTVAPAVTTEATVPPAPVTPATVPATNEATTGETPVPPDAPVTPEAPPKKNKK